MIISGVLTILGLTLLYFGAEALVRGSSGLGLRLGLSQLVVGLTIVAFGTSAPELAVSLNAAYLRQTDIAVGNVVGSNIANIGLILGLSALIRSLHIDVKLARIDVPIMIGVSVILCLLMLDERLKQIEGILLLAGLIGYTLFSIIEARRKQLPPHETIATGMLSRRAGWILEVVLIIGGLALLIIGGRYLVNGAVHIARLAGVSEAVIGLTIVAVGTSLPELATSVLAAARNMSDISVGNLVGSNIFNILGVLGASGLLVQLPLGNVTRVDLGVMLAFSVILLPLMRTGYTLKRWEGFLLLVGYAGYISWLTRPG
jgi:cation:H+ antiporter